MTIEDLRTLKVYCEMQKEWQLLELVDAEIKRQSVTDEDIQKLIAKYEKRIKNDEESIVEYRKSGNNELRIAANAVEGGLKNEQIILTALQQMKKEPCGMCESFWNAWRYNPLLKYCPNCGRKLGG